MPDGRKAGEPLSPGANPSYGAEKSGLLASLNSLTKIPYEWALDVKFIDLTKEQQMDVIARTCHDHM